MQSLKSAVRFIPIAGEFYGVYADYRIAVEQLNARNCSYDSEKDNGEVKKTIYKVDSLKSAINSEFSFFSDFDLLEELNDPEEVDSLEKGAQKIRSKETFDRDVKRSLIKNGLSLLSWPVYYALVPVTGPLTSYVISSGTLPLQEYLLKRKFLNEKSFVHLSESVVSSSFKAIVSGYLFSLVR